MRGGGAYAFDADETKPREQLLKGAGEAGRAFRIVQVVDFSFYAVAHDAAAQFDDGADV
jgi:hypothetical protein